MRSIKRGVKNLWSNSLKKGENDERLAPAKDRGTCLGKINIFRRKISSPSFT